MSAAASRQRAARLDPRSAEGRARLGLSTGSAPRRLGPIGPIGLVPARPVPFGRALAPPPVPRYPAYFVAAGAPRTARVAVEPGADEHLVVSDLASMLGSPGYEVEATLGGVPLAAQASDNVSRVFACAGCAPGSRSALELSLRGADLDDLDLAVFRTAAGTAIR